MKKIIYISFFIVAVCFSKQTIAQENLDSLRKICIASNQPDTSRVIAYLQIASQIYHSKIDSGFYYANKTFVLLNSNKTLKGISVEKKQLLKADVYNLLGEMFYYKGVMDSAIFYNTNANKIYDNYKSEKKLAQSLVTLGAIYDYQAKNKEALDNYKKAQQIFEKLNDTNGVAYALNNLGILYYSQGDSAIGLAYLEKCMALHLKKGNNEELIWTINSIGNIYVNKKNYKKALELYQQALLIDKKIESKSGLAYTFKNLGNYYLKLNILDSALYYHQKDLALYTQLKGESGIALSNTNIGRVYFEKGDYQQAKLYGETAYSITKNLNLTTRTFEVAELLKDVYNKTSEYKKALYFTNLWVQLKDSMRNAETERASLRQRMQYEYNQKELLADEKHKQELQLANEKEQKQKIVTYSIGTGLGLVGIFLFFVVNRLQVTSKQKKVIEKQKNEVEEAHHLLGEKHKEITDSISYAERIQRSFLATTEMLDKYLNPRHVIASPSADGRSNVKNEQIASLPSVVRNDESNYFVFFRPKDVVSGDFYWAGELSNGNFALSVADSTGHGVPGAIMSILNISSLEKSIEKETEADKILNQTRKIIIERLKKDGSLEGGKDGMDCSLLVFNQEKTQLSFAAANNPVFIVRPTVLAKETKQSHSNEQIASLPTVVRNDDNLKLQTLDSPVVGQAFELLEFKPDKMPVGKHDKDCESFTLRSTLLQKGDVIYTLTDGFPDQFGGSKGKKFMIKNLKELLLQIAHLPMPEQEQKLAEEFDNWKGSLEQVDDVCIIGVRI